MNKLKILILAFFFLVPSFVLASVNIQFESHPLFNDANFLPGHSVTRWVKVDNNLTTTEVVGAEAINWEGYSDWNNIPADDLSRVLTIEIKEGANTVYSSTTLYDFYKKGEVSLQGINPSTSKTYNFTISFPAGSGNTWQGKTTYFDIVVNSYQEETQSEEDNPPPNDDGPQGTTSGSLQGYWIPPEEGGSSAPTGGGGGGAGTEPEVKGAYTEKPVPPTGQPEKKDIVDDVLNLPNLNEIVPSLAATVGESLSKPSSYCWLLLILIIILILLFFLSIRKGKIEEKRAWWLLPILILILLILYYLYCPYCKLVIALIVLLSLIVYILLMKKA